MKKLLIIAALLVSASLNCLAQNEKGPLNVVSADSLNVLLKTYLQQTTGKRFEDPKIPRFLIADRNDLFVFGIGGYVGAKLVYDYYGNDALGFKAFNPAVSQQNNDVMNLDLTSSRFFFKILGNTKKGIMEAYMEAAFSGTNKLLQLKKAYINALGFRVGISVTSFADNQTIPIITDDAAISFNDRSVPMIEYSYLFKNGIRLQGGIEFPQATTVYAAENQIDERKVVTVEMPMPDFSLGGFYDKGGLHLHAGAYLRVMQFYDKYKTKEFVKVPGTAFQISGNYAIRSSEKLTHKIFFEAQYENKLADSFSTLQAKGLTAIMPNRIGWTSYDFTRGFGAQLGYSMIFGDNNVNIQASGNKIWGHELSGFDDMYKSGLVTTANYMRKFWKYGTIGAEFVYGQNRTIDNTMLRDYRVMGILRYDF